VLVNILIIVARKDREKATALCRKYGSAVQVKYHYVDSLSFFDNFFDNVLALGIDRIFCFGASFLGELSVRSGLKFSVKVHDSDDVMRGITIPVSIADRVVPLHCLASLKNANVNDAFWLHDFKNFGMVSEGVSEQCEVSVVSNDDDIDELDRLLRDEPIVAFDCETVGFVPYPRLNETPPELISVSFAFGGGKSYVILFDDFDELSQRKLRQLIAGWIVNKHPENQIRIAHNIKFDLLWLLHECVVGVAREWRVGNGEYYASGKFLTECWGQWHDTSLLAWLLDERRGGHSLKYLCSRYLGVSDWGVDVSDVRKLPREVLIKYNALDSFFTLKLFLELSREVVEKGFWRLYSELLIPAVLCFLEVELRGVKVCMDTFMQIKKRVEKDMKGKYAAVEELIVDRGDRMFNVDSPKQLGEYLVRLGYELPRNKTGYSVNAKALDRLAAECELVRKVLEYRDVRGLYNKYVHGLADKYMYADGDANCRLHGSYNLIATVTGRTSCNAPNMQNFPKRQNSWIRNMVRAGEGNALVSFDYGQIEARLFGMISGDERFLDDLVHGHDIHTELAKLVYAEEWATLSAVERKQRRAKCKGFIVFAMFYGAGKASVMENMRIDERLFYQCRDYLFGRYAKIRQWQGEMKERVFRLGYSESLFGRKRRLPFTYTEILNHCNQATSSDFTLYSMTKLARKFCLLFMIHDDLTFEIPAKDLERAIDVITKVMLSVPALFIKDSELVKQWVPFEVEVSAGVSWGELEFVKKVSTMDLGIGSLADAVAYTDIAEIELLRY